MQGETIPPLPDDPVDDILAQRARPAQMHSLWGQVGRRRMSELLSACTRAAQTGRSAESAIRALEPSRRLGDRPELSVEPGRPTHMPQAAIHQNVTPIDSG